MVQQNILTEMQQVATQQLALKNRLEAIVAMWTAESMNALTDADLQELAEFTHVTAQELAGAKNAMDTIAAAIGAYAAGTPATKLLRIVLTVPH
jgi:ATP-dependent Clp protease ATP-binding subunit ClpA